MKKSRVHQAHSGCHGAPSRPGSFLSIVLGLFAVAAISAAPWLVRDRTSPGAGPAAAGDGLRPRAEALIGYASSIRLTPEQEKVKADALSAIPAPCGNRNSLAVRCCGCNLFKSVSGLANQLIAREGADAGRVRQAVLDWIGSTNPSGYSGAACDRKRCERPFREDGCGSMREGRLVF